VEVKNRWRYEYFLAFDNLYDFYERKVDDDAGFDAAVVMKRRMPGRWWMAGPFACWRCAGSSRLTIPKANTFWKATFAEPVDYTLRKRYLTGICSKCGFTTAPAPGAGQDPAALNYFTHTVLMLTNSRMPWQDSSRP